MKGVGMYDCTQDDVHTMSNQPRTEIQIFLSNSI